MYMFVYGTILSGMRNNHRVEGCKFIGEAYTREKYYMTSLKTKCYPMVSYIPIHSSQRLTNIKGEVYEITEDVLKKIDNLEGHPYFYTHQEIEVKCHLKDSNDIKILNCYCYIILQPDIIRKIGEDYEDYSQNVNNGDWRDYFNKI
jgi:gamma-glutamylaminecyclotransferase